MVLTYNLVHTTLGSKELAANSNTSMSKLRLLLSQWQENIAEPNLAFLLEHQYTDANLCYDGLKGHDQQVAAHLREACDELGFRFYLANLEKKVYGGCDEDDGPYYGWNHDSGREGFHEIVEEVERSMSLTKIVDLNGMEIDKNIAFDEDQFTQENPFENEQPDDEDYSGFTGNEGVSATHFYHRTVKPLFLIHVSP